MRAGRLSSCIDALVGREVGGDDVQVVILAAEEPLCQDHLGHCGNGLLERGDGIAIALAHRHKHDRAEPKSDHLGVNLGAVRAHHPFGFEVT